MKETGHKFCNINHAAVSAEGVVPWHIFADDPLPGVYTLTHTAGIKTLAASFSSPVIDVKVDGAYVFVGSGADRTYDDGSGLLALMGAKPYVISSNNI